MEVVLFPLVQGLDAVDREQCGIRRNASTRYVCSSEKKRKAKDMFFSFLVREEKMCTLTQPRFELGTFSASN